MLIIMVLTSFQELIYKIDKIVLMKAMHWQLNIQIENISIFFFIVHYQEVHILICLKIKKHNETPD